jgi:hypothetical protein
MKDLPNKLKALPNMNPRQWSVVAQNIYQVDRNIWAFYHSAETLHRTTQTALETLPNEIVNHIAKFVQSDQRQLRELTYTDDALSPAGGGGGGINPVLKCAEHGENGRCNGPHADASSRSCVYHQRWKDKNK